MMAVSVLDREMYTEAEAARLLALPQSTLNYWLEGGMRGDRVYRPIIREEPRGDRQIVTWAEFIEAGLLRQYRREHRVPMAELRAFIDIVRREYDVPYPLAHHQPFISGRELLIEAQDAAGLDAEFCLVAVVRGQPLLTPAAESFVQRVTWHNDVATRWRPHDDPNSPVLIDPELRFGRPAIGGISTEALWEHEQAGETTEDIADEFGLSAGAVRWAIAYEQSARTAA
jgi:uncharacterized protein (DUF433 family)